jgi:hypothetical protein
MRRQWNRFPNPRLWSITATAVGPEGLMEDRSNQDEDLAAIRRGRERLQEQIRISQQTIDRCKELIKQMDELLEKRGAKC